MSFNITAFNEFEITGTVAPFGTTFKRDKTPAIFGQKDNSPRLIMEVSTEIEVPVEVKDAEGDAPVELKVRKRTVFISAKGDAAKKLEKIAKKIKAGDTVSVSGKGFIDRRPSKNGREFWNYWINDVQTLELV